MHKFWTIPTPNMIYTTLHNYTNMMVGKHGIHIVEIVVVVLLLLSPTVHIPYYFWTSGLSKYTDMSVSHERLFHHLDVTHTNQFYTLPFSSLSLCG